MFEHIITRFNEHIDLSSRCIEPITPVIHEAVINICDSLLKQKKVLCAGSFHCKSTAQQFCYYMQHQYKYERPALPVVDLSAVDGNDLEKNLQSLAQTGDTFLFFQGQNHQHNLHAILNTCKSLNVKVIVCHGISPAQNYLNNQELCISISIPSQDLIATLEIQWLIMHTFCELIDLQIFDYKG